MGTSHLFYYFNSPLLPPCFQEQSSPAVDPDRHMRNLSAELVAAFRAGTAAAFPDLTNEVPCPVLPASTKSTADYQFNGAMAISGLLKV